MTKTHIEITGARTHNLKNIDVRIPLGKLTVITGVSGSGKSSLAFDTLYAEGQRRYVESLSTYARQFIEKMARPDVDQIQNIQPAIAIEQKNSVKNARSTIGTATEINDYLRLLYSKAGMTICPDDHVEVREDNPQSVSAELIRAIPGERVYIVAPLEISASVSADSLRQELIRAAFTRILLPDAPEGKNVLKIDELTAADMKRAFSGDHVRVIVDRVVVQPEDHERIASSSALAFQAGKGTLEIWLADPDTSVTHPALRRCNTGGAGGCMVFHSGFRCNACGRSFPQPQPNLFSFNSPLGACPECSGFGRVIGIDWEKVIPDRTLSLDERAVATFNSPKYKKNYAWVRKSTTREEVPFDKPIKDFSKKQWKTLLYGNGDFEGLQGFFKWLEEDKYKIQNRITIARYRGFTPCTRCDGTRLVPDALNVWWAPANGPFGRRTLPELTAMAIKDLLAEFVQVKLTRPEEELYGRVFREVLSRLTYLVRVGLGYLTLDRQTRTLSGGESQRINLATALGTALTQTLYVLDEPTVGLHPRDSQRLLEILRDLRDKRNTIVVVEHDPEIILGADHLVDLGPRAGSNGGEVTFIGNPASLQDSDGRSQTAKFLGAKHPVSQTLFARTRPEQPGSARAIEIIRAREHNLQDLSVQIPLNRWVCITGVSGSGKTTLVHNVLYQGFNSHKRRATEDLGACEEIRGLDALDEILLIDQSPIGRSIRSNPVTYVKAYDPIRKLFASTREARTLGLSEGSFSFNVAGGRCERCEGTGVVTYDMHFLAEMTLPCDVCDGRRFQPRVLQVPYRGKAIHEILALTIDDAAEFFAGQASIVRRLRPLQDVGLGYLTLGQSTATLSGGEAQRLKLASHLAGDGDGSRIMMIFDEPTTGLHLADLAVLSGVFRRLVERNYSLVIIEHNIEIIRQADWIVDLGPEGGDQGGRLVAQGPPAEIAACRQSHTGRFLGK